MEQAFEQEKKCNVVSFRLTDADKEKLNKIIAEIHYNNGLRYSYGDIIRIALERYFKTQN